jgi:hypothetical protein
MRCDAMRCDASTLLIRCSELKARSAAPAGDFFRSDLVIGDPKGIHGGEIPIPSGSPITKSALSGNGSRAHGKKRVVEGQSPEWTYERAPKTWNFCRDFYNKLEEKSIALIGVRPVGSGHSDRRKSRHPFFDHKMRAR